MALKDRAARLAYQRATQMERYHRRRREAVQRFGGRCASCGSTTELEFDHVDPSTKQRSPVRALMSSPVVAAAELAKCQLLCSPCHERKTGQQLSKGHGHMGEWRRGCRCDACVEKARSCESRGLPAQPCFRIRGLPIPTRSTRSCR